MGRMMLMPFAAMVYTMEMFARTMRGLHIIAEEGIDVVTGEPSAAQPQNFMPREDAGTAAPAGGTQNPSSETTQKENKQMNDRDLSGDMLKLVRYKILFVKRDAEYVAHDHEELVHDSFSEDGYAAWKVAEYVTNHSVTRAGGEKYFLVEGKEHPVKDEKYLRVYFEVLERYPRQKLEYEERTLKAQERGADALESLKRSVEKLAAKEPTGATTS
jgi:hypothetical protein